MSLKLEVIGHKGVVGNATYQWLKAFGYDVVGRDNGCPKPKKGDVDVSFVCVGENDVAQVCKEAAQYNSELLVVRSTVKPGVCEKLQAAVKTHICHMPEFLKEATAVIDAFNQSFILIGGCCGEHTDYLRTLYAPACSEVVVVSRNTSAMVKLAINNYLACQISFWNEIDAISQAADVAGHLVGNIASLDPRVSKYGARFHNKFGGKCLPKDLKQTQDYAESKGVATELLDAVERVNEWQESL